MPPLEDSNCYKIENFMSVPMSHLVVLLEKASEIQQISTALISDLFSGGVLSNPASVYLAESPGSGCQSSTAEPHPD